METFIRKVDEAVASNDCATLCMIFSSTGLSSLGQGEQRTLCGYLVKKAVTSPEFLSVAFDNLTEVLTSCLGNLPMTVDNAADSTLRTLMFDYLVNEKGDYSSAARILVGMRMESETNSIYYKSPAEMCDGTFYFAIMRTCCVVFESMALARLLYLTLLFAPITICAPYCPVLYSTLLPVVYVKISECFLMDDEIVEADSAVTKAGTVVENIADPDNHTTLILRYKATYARVLDAFRKFLQAATRYHDLSLSNNSNNNSNNNMTDCIDADDLLQMLGRAATCAILAPSGAQKQRVLGLLYSDARLHQLDALPSMQTHATLVTKMYRAQVIRPEELVQFESSLAKHQQAIRGDGLSIIQHAVIEHNMVAVSRLYKSIYLKDLSKILGGIPAEKMAATMIMDGSLHGEIDQVDGILHFTSGQEDDQDDWNRGIMSFCTELNKVVDRLTLVLP